jgi:uncharacterized protein YecE (DUF72 family)
MNSRGLSRPRPTASCTAHGRNGRRRHEPLTWESKDIPERFDYRYTEDELSQWASRVRALACAADVTHVLFNNCYRGSAQVNARQFAALVAT